MTSAARDYRTAEGVARCSSDESVLARYLRVARVAAPQLSATHPLPFARPEILSALSALDYSLLLDVLDELTILEAAARYSDRKAQPIAKRRLYRALAAEVGCRPADIEKLFKQVDKTSVPILRGVARVLLGRHVAEPKASIADGERGRIYYLTFSKDEALPS